MAKQDLHSRDNNENSKNSKTKTEIQQRQAKNKQNKKIQTSKIYFPADPNYACPVLI